MPGYIIHLTEAERVFGAMPEAWRREIADLSAWHDAFICGVLLPDAAGKKVKARTHYWNEERVNDAIVVPDMAKFFHKHARELTQPVVLGYLTHLHLDKVFFTEYFHCKVRFLDENGQETMERQSVKTAWLVEEERELSPKELFSNSWLYSDYTKLNTLLIQGYGLSLPETALTLENPFEMDTEELMERAYTEIAGYLEESKTAVGEPKLLSVESLECFMDEAAHDFWKMVEQYG